MSELESYRERVFRGVEELVSAAGSLIEHYTREPARGNVRLGITERIVRHYLSEGLLGSPTGHAGPAMLFNYGNLLRLIAVKKLLADHWSVVKIREFMAALDTTALEQLVNTAMTSDHATRKKAGRERADEDQQTFRVTQRLPQHAEEGPDTPAPSMSLASAPPPLASLAVESARRADRASAEWIELATGLEIKIRRSFRPPRSEQERERLVVRFLSVVNKRKQ